MRIFWKVSVYDDVAGIFFVKHCCLTKKQAQDIVTSYFDKDALARCTPHIKIPSKTSNKK